MKNMTINVDGVVYAIEISDNNGWVCDKCDMRFRKICKMVDDKMFPDDVTPICNQLAVMSGYALEECVGSYMVEVKYE